MSGSDVVCLYHADCFDGMGSAWVVKQRFPEARFHAMTYRDPLPEGLEGKHVIMVDFSLDTLEEMLALARLAGKFTFLDHHERSHHYVRELWALNAVTDLEIDAWYADDRSGAVIAWEHFFAGRAVPFFLMCISDRDLWLFKYPMTRDVMAGLGMYQLDLDTWCELTKGVDFFIPHQDKEFVDQLAQVGRAILTKTRIDVERVIEQTLRYMTWSDGTKVPLINVPRSLASEALAVLATTHDFAVGYYDGPNSRVFSLRSRKDGGRIVNVLAREYGGDGHPHAAGFMVPRDHPLATF